MSPLFEDENRETKHGKYYNKPSQGRTSGRFMWTCLIVLAGLTATTYVLLGYLAYTVIWVQEYKNEDARDQDFQIFNGEGERI